MPVGRYGFFVDPALRLTFSVVPLAQAGQARRLNEADEQRNPKHRAARMDLNWIVVVVISNAPF